MKFEKKNFVFRRGNQLLRPHPDPWGREPANRQSQVNRSRQVHVHQGKRSRVHFRFRQPHCSRPDSDCSASGRLQSDPRPHRVSDLQSLRRQKCSLSSKKNILKWNVTKIELRWRHSFADHNITMVHFTIIRRHLLLIMTSQFKWSYHGTFYLV